MTLTNNWVWYLVPRYDFCEHLRLVSRAASQMLGILRKTWRVFHNRLLLGRCLQGFVLSVLEYCSAVLCSAAKTHLKLLDRVASGDSFLFECAIAHRRYVAALCTLYKIRCNRMHPLNGVLPVSYVKVRVHTVLWSHIGILMCLFAAELHSTVGLLFPSQCLWGTILLTPGLYSMVWDWPVLRAGPMLFYWP